CGRGRGAARAYQDGVSARDLHPADSVHAAARTGRTARRRGPHGRPAMTLDVRTGVAIADLYLARGRLRAELNMQGFGRLSDLFNNAPGDFIAASMRMASAVSGRHEIAFERRELVVRLSEVRLVRPIEENPSVASTSAWRERLPVRVVLDVDDWQITGDIYL